MAVGSTPPAPGEGTPASRRRKPWIRIGLAVFFLLLILDAYTATTSARQSLSRAREALRAGADALANGSAADASANFQAAAEAAADAAASAGPPSFGIARLIPPLRDDVDAVRTVASAASTTSGAAIALTQAAVDAGWDERDAGALDISLITQIAPALERSARDLTRAIDELRAIPTEGLFEPIRSDLLEARSDLEARAGLFSRAADLAQLLPSFLQEGRRYLLVVQDLAEPRATGGKMGPYGALRVVDGQLVLEELFHTERLDEANTTPGLPAVARVILPTAEDLGWGSFDGIMMIDQVWISYMLEATGPIDVAGVAKPLDSENAVQVLSRDVFLDDEGYALREAAVTAFWEAVEERRLSADALMTALSRGADERHLQVYSVDAREQELLARLGADGAVRLGQNPISVVWSSLVDNKATWLQDRRLDVVATLVDGGWAKVTTTMRLRNRADDEPPGELLGTGRDHPVGTWASRVTVYMPEDIEAFPSFEGSAAADPELGSSLGRPVASGTVWAPAREEMFWSVTYVASDAWVPGPDGGGRYQMDFFPQPAIQPLAVKIAIIVPNGYSPTEGSPGMVLESEGAVWQDRPATAQSVWIRFS